MYIKIIQPKELARILFFFNMIKYDQASSICIFNKIYVREILIRTNLQAQFSINRQHLIY